MIRIRLYLLIAASLIGTRASAWSHKEHIQLTRIATQRLLADPQTPQAMKDWLKQAAPALPTAAQEREYFMKQRVGPIVRGVDGLAFWATVPDTVGVLWGSGDTEKKVEPFGVGEQSLHYVDLENFMLEEERWRHRPDLSNKPLLYDIPNGMREDRKEDEGKFASRKGRWKRAGYLPFRIEQCYGQLVKNLRDKRLVDQPGQFPRDEHATRWAGYLAHYIEDNTQPQHATEDFRSRSYFADKRNAPNVHWDVEGRLCDDEEADYPELRKEFWDIFLKSLDEVEDPFDSEDLRTATLEVSLASYDALSLIGMAAMKAYGQAGTPDNPTGPIGKFDAGVFFNFKGKYRDREMTLMEMKAYQMAWSVKRVERLWRRAWDESRRPIDPLP